MANRLSQIATRTGDNGTTGLGDNTRVSKDSLRVHAMGDVDELNSHIGVLLCEELPPGVRELLVEVQHQLFNLGGSSSQSSTPMCELSSSTSPMAWTRRLSLDTRVLSPRPVVPLSPVRVAICESLLAMVRRRGEAR